MTVNERDVIVTCNRGHSYPAFVPEGRPEPSRCGVRLPRGICNRPVTVADAPEKQLVQNG